jgi:hypothetical protein
MALDDLPGGIEPIFRIRKVHVEQADVGIMNGDCGHTGGNCGRHRQDLMMALRKGSG